MVQALLLGYLVKLKAAGTEPGPDDLPILLQLIDRRLAAIGQHNRALQASAEKMTRAEARAVLAGVVGIIGRHVTDDSILRAIQADVVTAIDRGGFGNDATTSE